MKRTALGRFAHEDCRASRAIEGQPFAFYMGMTLVNTFINLSLRMQLGIPAGY